MRYNGQISQSTSRTLWAYAVPSADCD